MPPAPERFMRYAGNGMLHSLNVADGEDVAPAVKFGFPNGKSYALNMWNGVIFTTTSQGCNGNPNQVWAINVNDPNHKVMTFNPGERRTVGPEGAAIDSTGTAWAPTGDGTYDPENHMFGNGLIGVHVVGNELQLKDWFEPKDWFWMQKRDLDMQVTPAIFDFKGKELMATGSKACRVYLLDTANAGGDDHQTPLVQTPLMCNEEVNFASAGIWGSMATLEGCERHAMGADAVLGRGASRFQGSGLIRPREARRRCRVQSGRERTANTNLRQPGCPAT